MASRGATSCLACALACVLIAGGAIADAGADSPSVEPIEAQPLGAPKQSASGNEPAAPSLGVDRTVVATAAVLAAILGSAVIVRFVSKRTGGLAGAAGPGGEAPAGILTVLGRYPLARGTTLILMQVDRRVLLLSQSQTKGGAPTLQTLSEFNDPAQVSSLLTKARRSDGGSFADRWRQAVDESAPEPEPRSHGEVEVVDLTRRGGRV